MCVCVCARDSVSYVRVLRQNTIRRTCSNTHTRTHDQEDKFEYRELRFRASKAVNATVVGMEAISSSSVASNESHVILFGGYLGNSRTAAVHTYTLAASSPDLALEPMLILATGPSARSMPGVVKPDDSSLVMFGGVVTEIQNGVTVQSALNDLWQVCTCVCMCASWACACVCVCMCVRSWHA